jgi:hypothetical protein
MDFRSAFLTDVLRTFRNYRTLAEKAIAQVSDEDLHALLDDDANSIAVIAKHVGGNLRSRFSDFLTTDGEKPDRLRDTEFEMPERATRKQIMAWWDRGWSTALASIEALTPDDLERTIHIRKEPLLVVEALNRSCAHTASHVGQIVLLAKHFAGPKWSTLSIPKGRSAEHAVGTFKQGIIPPQK